MHRHQLAFNDAIALDRALLSRGEAPSFLALYERRLRAGDAIIAPHATPTDAVGHLLQQAARLQARMAELLRLLGDRANALLDRPGTPVLVDQLEIELHAERCTEQVQAVIDAVRRTEGIKRE